MGYRFASIGRKIAHFGAEEMASVAGTGIFGMVAILKRAALTPAALALTAVALGGCMGTTYGTGVNPGAQTVKDIGGLVDLGGQKKSTIDYKPRPPLAAPPPGVAPPPPGSAGVVASSGDWPNDPDVAAGARKAGDGRNAALGKNAYYAKTDALSDPGIKVPVQHPTGVIWNNRDGSAEAAASTKEQDAQTKKLMADAKSAVGVDANGNPIRKTLSDPPVTYREPDPSAPTSFKSVKKFHWPWQKAQPDAAPTGLADDSAGGKSAISDRTTLNDKVAQ
jgi:predicted small secreted protein